MQRIYRQAWRRGWIWVLVGLLGLSQAAFCRAAQANSDAPALLSAYYRYVLVQQVPPQAQTLIANAPAENQLAVKETLREWVTGAQRRIREDLQRQFGAQARGQFEKFVAEYANAEGLGDAAFLANLAAGLGLSPTPASFLELRQAVVGSRLKPEVEEASRFLSEIQTWLDLKRRRSDVPSLAIWVHRGEKSAPAAPLTLATAEAVTSAEALPEDGAASSSLDAFASLRKSRRDKAQQLAQAGMQQVATEREAAEQEYGAKKLTAAQMEADNIKRHAEKLAQGEKDALDQEANSWGMKLKGMVSATISAGVGAFTGAIGSQAAQKAANQLFPPPGAKN